MLYRNFPLFITKDKDGNHVATCPDLGFECVIHSMTLAEACGCATCVIQQYCTLLTEHELPLPDATPFEVAELSAPEKTLLATTVIVEIREEGDTES
jgi:predicted RNase H-like HicB family nuclease